MYRCASLAITTFHSNEVKQLSSPSLPISPPPRVNSLVYFPSPSYALPPGMYFIGANVIR